MNELNEADLIWMKQNKIPLPSTKIKGLITVDELVNRNKLNPIRKKNHLLVNDYDVELEKAIVGKTFRQLISEASIWNDNKYLQVNLNKEIDCSGIIVYHLKVQGKINASLINYLDEDGGSLKVNKSYIHEFNRDFTTVNSSLINQVKTNNNDNEFNNVRGIFLDLIIEEEDDNIHREDKYNDKSHFRKYSSAFNNLNACETMKNRYEKISEELLARK